MIFIINFFNFWTNIISLRFLVYLDFLKFFFNDLIVYYLIVYLLIVFYDLYFWKFNIFLEIWNFDKNRMMTYDHFNHQNKIPLKNFKLIILQFTFDICISRNLIYHIFFIGKYFYQKWYIILLKILKSY